MHEEDRPEVLLREGQRCRRSRLAIVCPWMRDEDSDPMYTKCVG